jgi:hypothetical protein
MALDFPVNPTTGQTYFNWKWDGAKWVRLSEAPAAGVDSFNGRTGAITLGSSDVSAAGGALIDNPDFTGSPTCPTPSPGDNSTNIATTAFVDAAIAATPASGVSSFNSRTGAVTLTTADLAGVGGAPLASPVFTGNPTAPTPAAGDSDTSVATTSFVATSFAPLNSPVFTGAPTAPTVAVGDNSTKIATTAWVQSQPIASGDNRLLNGDMLVNQRGATSWPGTGAGIYVVDRWAFLSNVAAVKFTWSVNLAGPPALVGFPYYIGFKSNSAYTVAAGDQFQCYQGVEADAVGDLAWGTANAQAVTLSFWACSSLTGTFSGAVQNYAQTRSYPFAFSLPNANTWAKITLTIPGDTAGTWVMSGNGGALYVSFDLGCGTTARGAAGVWASGNLLGVTGAVQVVHTNLATFGLTGVKLEIGSIATPFSRKSLARNLADCQRYYYAPKHTALAGGYAPTAAGLSIFALRPFPVTMRATPAQAGATFSNINANAPTLFNSNTTGAVWSCTNAVIGVFQLGVLTDTYSAEL